MTHAALNSSKTAATLNANQALRDLVAAMPVVIFAKAVGAALQRTGKRVSGSLQTA